MRPLLKRRLLCVAAALAARTSNFAKAGDPNGGGLPASPRFTAGDQIVLVVRNGGPQIVKNRDAERMDVLEPVSLALMRATP